MSKQGENKRYYAKNRETLLVKQKIRAEKRKAQISIQKALYYEKTKEIKKVYVSNYRKNNRDKVNTLYNKHYTSKLNRKPKWLTQIQLKEIEQYYIDSAYIQQLMQTPMAVDHIVPLQGKNVSGLHVPWNLQILTKTENSKKSNKYDY